MLGPQRIVKSHAKADGPLGETQRGKKNVCHPAGFIILINHTILVQWLPMFGLSHLGQLDLRLDVITALNITESHRVKVIAFSMIV